MSKFKIAAGIMIIHGGLIEILGCLAVSISLLLGINTNIINKVYTFIIPYLQDNKTLMIPMGLILGIMRLLGGVSLLKNRLWGLVLSIINCVVTMAIMIFMLPSGLIDGLLSCSALVLMLTQYYGNKTIDIIQ